jgi:TetR/AcrR family transcriptional repressor of nem operon
MELLQHWESIIADALIAAQATGQISPDQDVYDLAATLVEAWECAVLRGKVEQRRDSYRRFEESVLPRILGQVSPVRAAASS